MLHMTHQIMTHMTITMAMTLNFLLTLEIVHQNVNAQKVQSAKGDKMHVRRSLDQMVVVQDKKVEIVPQNVNAQIVQGAKGDKMHVSRILLILLILHKILLILVEIVYQNVNALAKHL